MDEILIVIFLILSFLKLIDKVKDCDNILGKIQGAMKEKDISKKELLIKDIISVGEYK